MASLGHVMVGLALARAHGHAAAPPRRGLSAVALLAFPALAMLPDLDVIAFAFGIPYRDQLGHRGASHALLTGLVVGALVGVLVARLTRTRVATSALLGALAMVSHGLLDALTTGGEGVALLWPFTDERLFAPIRLIPVAPIGRGFISARGLFCAAFELALFSPFLLYALVARPGGRRSQPATPGRERS